MVSSRSGLVEKSATGIPVSSSRRRIYLTALAGNSAQLRAPPGGFLPARHFLINRRAGGLSRAFGRKPVDFLAVQLIADTDFQHLKPVQHIQLGQRHAINTGGQPSLPDHHRIKPATAPLAPGHRAEFPAPLTKPVTLGAKILSWKWARADARGIGFGNAQHKTRQFRARCQSRSPPVRPPYWMRSQTDRCHGQHPASPLVRPQTEPADCAPLPLPAPASCARYKATAPGSPLAGQPASARHPPCHGRLPPARHYASWPALVIRSASRPVSARSATRTARLPILSS